MHLPSIMWSQNCMKKTEEINSFGDIVSCVKQASKINCVNKYMAFLGELCVHPYVTMVSAHWTAKLSDNEQNYNGNGV